MKINGNIHGRLYMLVQGLITVYLHHICKI
jgi:hypothetical protein